MHSLLTAVLKTIFVFVFLAVALLPKEGRAEEKPVDSLQDTIAAILTSFGGKASVDAVKSVAAKGTISDFMKGIEGEYARYYARPLKLRIEIMSDLGGEVRVLNGTRGWQGNTTVLKEAKPISVQSMLYQYTYLDLPMGFADSSVSVTYGGKTELNGRSHILLHVETAGAPKLRVFVDPKKHLIVRVAADFNMGMGSSELATEYEDFRLVGKVLFPFRLINYAGNMKLSVITLADIKVNAVIPDTFFSQNLGE